MPEPGNAPGWHECVSKTGGHGGHQGAAGIAKRGARISSRGWLRGCQWSEVRPPAFDGHLLSECAISVGGQNDPRFCGCDLDLARRELAWPAGTLRPEVEVGNGSNISANQRGKSYDILHEREDSDSAHRRSLPWLSRGCPQEVCRPTSGELPT